MPVQSRKFNCQSRIKVQQPCSLLRLLPIADEGQAFCSPSMSAEYRKSDVLLMAREDIAVEDQEKVKNNLKKSELFELLDL